VTVGDVHAWHARELLATWRRRRRRLLARLALESVDFDLNGEFAPKIPDVWLVPGSAS
jgi:hypothetical protein